MYSQVFLLYYSLFNLYNLLENPYSQYYVYLKALNLAIEGKVTENVVPSFKKIDSFLKEWNIGIVDQRKLFLTISNVLKENKRYNGSVSFLTYACFLYIYTDELALSNI